MENAPREILYDLFSRETEIRISFLVLTTFRRRSRDTTDPRDPPEPVPHLPEELHHLDKRRDGNEQSENLGDVSFLKAIAHAGNILGQN